MVNGKLNHIIMKEKIEFQRLVGSSAVMHYRIGSHTKTESAQRLCLKGFGILFLN